jgi:hypothetical protein
VKLYKERYKREPKDLNKYRDKWGFAAMFDQYGMDRSKKIIEYYLDSNKIGHPVNHLLFNYEKINEFMAEAERDREERKRLMAESKKRVEEWRGKQ